MFALKSTVKAIELERDLMLKLFHTAERQLAELLGEVGKARDREKAALIQVERLRRELAEIRSQVKPEQFDQNDLVDLRGLVHPDKHQGRLTAVRLSQKVNGYIQEPKVRKIKTGEKPTNHRPGQGEW